MRKYIYLFIIVVVQTQKEKWMNEMVGWFGVWINSGEGKLYNNLPRPKK
jgi:hypothetical protein